MGDIQEMSFQNVVDTILKPQGIKVGGYPDELFLDMSEKDRERWQCNICYLVVREPQQCDNKHKFCATCVFAWSMTYGANSDKCPVCRVKQHEYARDRKIEAELAMKWVKCPEKGCALRCPLRDFLQHSHGMKLYAGQPGTDLNSLRRERPAPVNPMGHPGIVFLPSLGRADNGSSVREGRNLLQDMMLVLHLEMELRRRAIDRFSSENNDAERARHMSEVLAIQEQMQEITGFLNILFSIPPNQQATRRRVGMGNFPGGTAIDETTDSSDSDSSDSSGVVSRYRLAERQRQQQRSSAAVVTGNRPTLNRAQQDQNTVRTSNTVRAPSARSMLRRSEIREELAMINNDSDTQTLDLTRPAAASQVTGSTQAANQRAAGQAYASRQSSTTNVTTDSEDISPTRYQPPLTNSVARQTNESPLLSPPLVAGTQTTGPDTQATGVRSRLLSARERVGEEPSGLPRSSSTFQSALESLPPISRRNSLVEDSGAEDTESIFREIGPNTRSTVLAPQPGLAPTPHRRPAPPSGPGPSLNTTRLRRRSTTTNSQSNTNSQTSTTTHRQATNTANPRPVGNPTGQRPTGNASTVSRQNSNPLPRRPAAGRHHSRGRSDSTVPSNTTTGRTSGSVAGTSGALLRARRRSEIQQHLQRNVANNEEDENS